MESYGQTIAKLRDERQWTQRELAEHAGVPLRTIQDIELDKVRKPQRKTAQRLAAALDIEGDARETRQSWANDVQLFLDMMGAFLSEFPETQRLKMMSSIAGDLPELARSIGGRPNGQHG